MYSITPELAVGRRADAEDTALLSAHGIQALLSLCAVPRPEGVVRQLSLDIRDRVALPGDSIDEAMAFIKAQLAAGRKVLVHCEMGISRSTSIVVGYMHGICGMPFDAALALVRSANPIADPHPALLDSLRRHFASGAESVLLSGNENPLGPSPLAIAALGRQLDRLHRYPDKDAVLLRDKLAAALAVEPAQVMLGNGSCELIEHLARACLKPGDEAVVPLPSFPVYRSAVRAVGGLVVGVPLHAGRFDVDAILASITPRTRLVMIGTPNNPTGTLLPPADLDCLVEALPQEIWLLVDEAYRDYVEPSEMGDALGWIARGRNVIVLRSFSKAYGLAGLRIGYGAAPVWIASAVGKQRQSYNTNALAQAAAAAALEDTRHLAQTRANNSAELARVQRRLAALGVPFIPSQANFVLVQGGAEIAEQLGRAGVEVKDMARFGAPDCFRVSIGLATENTRFLQAYETLLRNAQAQIPQPQFEGEAAW